MLISAEVIKNPKTYQYCATCNMTLIKGEPRLRLYGAAHRGDPPYVIYSHFACALMDPHKKIREAI